LTTQPFDNFQPSLALTIVTPTSGIFPSGGGGGSATGDTLGFVYYFAGNFAPAGSITTAGQLLSITSNSVLFDLLGTTYGGNGTTNFALPNLQGEAIVGTGAGQVLGVDTGSATVTLTSAELPPPSGSDQSFSNFEPSLPLETLICTSGVFPSQGGNSGSSTFIGQIANFAGGFVPAGWTLAAGQLLSIAQNEALFSILGTTYGGDGITTFALPNLQGRVAVGANASHPLGTVFGEASTALTTGELPPGGAPVTNDQPSVSVEYLIATSGIFPSQGSGSSFNSTTPTLGQITEFAGNFAPSGWALASGQLLSIAQNLALFSVIGTTYGGDGITTFALPNLNGRTVIGANGTNYILGTTYGADSTTLTSANIPPPCYRRGTLILTDRGEVPVEELTIGDRVVTVSGEAKPVRWIGMRSYDGRFIAGKRNVLPIVIKAGALSEGIPTRDLWISPEHALYIDRLLVPARLLVNGMTITQVPAVERLEYFHIELDPHDVIFAEGAAAETYVECDNRLMFQNASEYGKLYPEGLACSGRSCALRIGEGMAAVTIRKRLLARAAALGNAMTSDPGLHLVADGIAMPPIAAEDGVYRFVLKTPAGEVWLASRSSVPAETDAASTDRRRLGVCLHRVTLRDADFTFDVLPGNPHLCEGFHEKEGEHRWTDGMARLPGRVLALFAGPADIEVALWPSQLRYPHAPSAVTEIIEPQESSGCHDRLAGKRTDALTTAA